MHSSIYSSIRPSNHSTTLRRPIVPNVLYKWPVAPGLAYFPKQPPMVNDEISLEFRHRKRSGLQGWLEILSPQEIVYPWLFGVLLITWKAIAKFEFHWIEALGYRRVLSTFFLSSWCPLSVSSSSTTAAQILLEMQYMVLIVGLRYPFVRSKTPSNSSHLGSRSEDVVTSFNQWNCF